MADLAASAQRLDGEYTIPTLKWTMGDWYPVAGRYLYVAVTAVDEGNNRVTGTGPDGQVVRGSFGLGAPVVGERRRVFRIAGGQYVFEDLA